MSNLFAGTIQVVYKCFCVVKMSLLLPPNWRAIDFPISEHLLHRNHRTLSFFPVSVLARPHRKFLSDIAAKGGDSQPHTHVSISRIWYWFQHKHKLEAVSYVIKLSSIIFSSLLTVAGLLTRDDCVQIGWFPRILSRLTEWTWAKETAFKLSAALDFLIYLLGFQINSF